MAVLLLAEHDNKTLAASTAKALTAARAFGGNVDILVAGEGCRAVADEAAKLEGVGKVLLADAPQLAHRLAEDTTATILPLMANYTVLLAPATTMGKNVLPRVAALLDVGQISDIVEVKSPDTFVRPIYAGNALETVQTSDKIVVATVRTTAFAATGEGGSAAIETVTPADEVTSSSFVGADITESERPELTAARVVISGGRGMASGENFEKLIAPIADRLGAAIGASRAAVDSGYMPNDYQVGQTGKVVAPELYVAVGISGAIQHLAGMKDSKVIVAINKDAEAPIFQVADYGLVGDLFEVLPELNEELKKAGYGD
ncbi:MAG: FAD-binding protein [Methyloceanibacter sp.]|uniref:electron transfer flavoprotein subunit alpha/FixB family protein n=1 Tax=Methyloceanibacter sp. TaxID=1965321 RepID=UPI001D348E79|nr:FAD-binding protein [Methyloceanibacter sp.]MCB1442616.1 FAD-binding protein [Methyloceanibacter sp.]MCC0059503.1 electron transfer flavoprotein subunit alpha/FixB family protein [Hyphomicrobiaceae bacterium]